MFIPTISPKCTQELLPTTKTTIPLARHEAPGMTLFPAGQLRMWGQSQHYTGCREPQSKMLEEKIAVG